jgi:subtilisin family serine protease
VKEVVQELHDAAATAQRPLLQLLARRHGEGRVDAVTPLWILNGILITAKPDVVAELAARADVLEVRTVRTLKASDSLVAAPPEPNVSLVNAPALWNLGNRGEGVVVASLDTGVDGTHPDLAASWRGGTDSWYDPYGQHPTTPVDLNGHGTWTMGAVVGGEAGGTAIGVAPGAKWIAAKIFNDQGVATTAAIHQAFQWLLDPDGNPSTNDAPNIVNGSWTMGVTGCDLEFQLDLRALRAAGVLPVFAAGNGGPGAATSYSPANNPDAFSVGATDAVDSIYSASSRGPSACDGSVFPDLVAPGVNVRTTDLYGYYASETGTSMAAPHVTGALALLMSAFPGLGVDRQEAALESGAVDLGPVGPDNDTGYGRLDVLGAYNWLKTAPDFAVSATPNSASTVAGGTASFTVGVAAINGFAGDVALAFSGLDASQATWTLTPSTIVGGSGTATLSVTAAASLAAGSYRLAVAGTSGATRRTTYVTLRIAPPPDFTVTATPASASTLPGGSVSYSVDVGSLDGFGADVALSLSGLTTAQATWTFTPPTVSGSGRSTLTVNPSASLAPATYALTVKGTSGTTSHTAAVNLVVLQPPDFTLTASPSSQSAVAGSTFNYTVTVGAKGGFSGSVALTLTGVTTSQASWTFTPPSVTTSGTAKLAVTTGSTLAAGAYKLTITGRSGTLTHTATVNMLVSAPPDFVLTATPSSATVTAGGSVTYTVSTASRGSFAGNVTLALSGLPAGATATFTPNPVGTPASSTLRVQTTGSTTRGTFTLRVTGTSGALTHQLTVGLTVN